MAFDRVVDSAVLDQTLQATADAIRVKSGGTSAIAFENFPSEVMGIDRLQKMTIYPDELDNGFIGNLVAKVAASYHCARLLGKEDFVYNQTAGIFGGDNPILRDAQGTDTAGQARIDCSTFVGLALRGISYENSPYAKHPYDENTENRWTPAEELPSMYGAYGWEFPWIDKQPEGLYNSIGMDGFSTLRSAADFGECFYKNGKVIYDRKAEGALTDTTANELLGKLKPGDLMFLASEGATDTQKKRFRYISHVAIVAENTEKVLEANGGDKAVFYTSWSNYRNTVTLVCRPNYCAKVKAEIPGGVNLLSYPWQFNIETSYTEKGITLEPLDMQVIHASGTATADCGIEIAGIVESSYNPITLEPGTYQMSFMSNPDTPSTTNISLQLRRETDGSWNEANIKAQNNKPVEFEIEETTNVYVRLYVTSGYSINGDIAPALVRIA